MGTAYAALTAAINEVVNALFHVDITLVQYPSQGDFPWCYANPNQVFNALTAGYLSGRVVPGQDPDLVQLSGPGSLTEMGARLVGSLTYELSGADRQRADPAQLAFQQQQLARVRRMVAAGSTPTSANGGMQTIDPVTGAISAQWQPAYAVNVAIAAIQDALTGGGDTITVTVPPAQVGGSSVVFTYPNAVMVGCGPVPWQDAAGTGWWVDEPIGEAFANVGRDVTGYAFTTAPPYLPGPIQAGGNAGHLVALLLSQPPRLTVTANPVPPPGVSPRPNSGSAGLRMLARSAPDLNESDLSGSDLSGSAMSGSDLSDSALEVLSSYALLGLGVEGAVTYSESVTPARSPGRRPAYPDPCLVPTSPSGPGAAIQLAPVQGPTVPLLQQTAYVVGAVIGTW